MAKPRLLLFVLLLGLSLLLVACEGGVLDLPYVAGGSGLPGAASRQILLLAPEGSRIASSQAAAEGLAGAGTWCVVTESDAGKERWIVFRDVQEEQRDTYGLRLAEGPLDFETLGCTNWEDWHAIDRALKTTTGP